MRNVTAIVVVATLISCAATPCEQEAELRASCASSTADDQSIEQALAECADDSIDACLADCGLDNEDELCDILDQAARVEVISAYTDCLAACGEAG